MIKIQTDKFTETTISIRWFVPLSSEDITAWNLLNMILSRSTEKFDSREASAKAVARAYGARCGFGLSAYGDCLKVEFRMTFLRENLIQEPDYTDQLITLLDQFLHHPLITPEILDETKYLLRNSLEAISQDPDARSVEQAFASFSKSPAVSTPVRGSLDDLPGITTDQIEKLYSTLMQTPCQIFICGTLSDRLEESVRKLGPSDRIYTTWQAAVGEDEPMELCETRDISQSSLCRVYTAGILPQDPDYYPFLVLNALLGASSVSLLFEQVREQNSLCYSISSSLVRFAGLLVITTGADRKNLPQVIELVEDILRQVRDGEVSQETFDLVKAEITDGMRGQKDSAMSMIEQEFLNEILDRPVTQDESIAKIEQVMLEDVARAALRLKLAVNSAVVQSDKAPALEEKTEYAS